MARYKPNPIVPITRGTLGGITISENRDGLYTKMKADNPKNPRTDAQQAVRNSFSKYTRQWRTLTEQQRLSWATL